MKNTYLKSLLTISLLVTFSALMSGCGELNSQFSCPMKPGVTCQSLDQVNMMVDQGQLIQKPAAPAAHVDQAVNAQNFSNLNIRSPEQVIRVWIAPYQDTQGNYFSSAWVYRVIEPGHWSVKFTIKDDAHV